MNKNEQMTLYSSYNFTILRSQYVQVFLATQLDLALIISTYILLGLYVKVFMDILHLQPHKLLN